MLSEDSYLLEGLQSVDKTKMHPKEKLQNAPTFTGNGSHSHISTNDIHRCILYFRSPHNAKTTIGQYRLSAKRPIIGRYGLLADYRFISTKHLLRKTGLSLSSSHDEVSGSVNCSMYVDIRYCVTNCSSVVMSDSVSSSSVVTRPPYLYCNAIISSIYHRIYYQTTVIITVSRSRLSCLLVCF